MVYPYLKLHILFYSNSLAIWSNRWKPWDFFGELTRSSKEQYDSGESAGDLIRIHIRNSSPSWFATVWLGHNVIIKNVKNEYGRHRRLKG